MVYKPLVKLSLLFKEEVNFLVGKYSNVTQQCQTLL